MKKRVDAPLGEYWKFVRAMSALTQVVNEWDSSDEMVVNMQCQYLETSASAEDAIHNYRVTLSVAHTGKCAAIQYDTEVPTSKENITLGSISFSVALDGDRIANFLYKSVGKPIPMDEFVGVTTEKSGQMYIYIGETRAKHGTGTYVDIKPAGKTVDFEGMLRSERYSRASMSPEFIEAIYDWSKNSGSSTPFGVTVFPSGKVITSISAVEKSGGVFFTNITASEKLDMDGNRAPVYVRQASADPDWLSLPASETVTMTKDMWSAANEVCDELKAATHSEIRLVESIKVKGHDSTIIKIPMIIGILKHGMVHKLGRPTTQHWGNAYLLTSHHMFPKAFPMANQIPEKDFVIKMDDLREQVQRIIASKKNGGGFVYAIFNEDDGVAHITEFETGIDQAKKQVVRMRLPQIAAIIDIESSSGELPRQVVFEKHGSHIQAMPVPSNGYHYTMTARGR